eukprot:1160960-Pelagomonas_calceolata.AAC.1
MNQDDVLGLGKFVSAYLNAENEFYALHLFARSERSITSAILLQLSCPLSASKLSDKLHAHSVKYAHKFVTIRRAIVNNSTPHSYVLELGASNNPPNTHLPFLFLLSCGGDLRPFGANQAEQPDYLAEVQKTSKPYNIVS